ncbi:MAG: hypothetical protein LC637_08225 [Xanthomonadaceae bacterium]|nr:hypothetical protein [Xanthomonadaceae bacterium]
MADDLPASCSFSPQVPIPAGAQCPGQCPSLLECGFSGLAVGESKTFRFEVDGSSHGEQFHIQSDVSLDGELRDPQLTDNVEDIIVVTGPAGA